MKRARKPFPLPPETLPSGERVLLYVYRFLRTHGYSPHAEPASRALGWSEANAAHHLKRLRELGWVSWDPETRHTLTLSKAGAVQAEHIEWCLLHQPEART